MEYRCSECGRWLKKPHVDLLHPEAELIEWTQSRRAAYDYVRRDGDIVVLDMFRNRPHDAERYYPGAAYIDVRDAAEWLARWEPEYEAPPARPTNPLFSPTPTSRGRFEKERHSP